MKSLLFMSVFISSVFYCVNESFALDTESAQNIAKKTEQINIARLEGLRSDCLIKNSGNQRLCQRKVLKQCRDSMSKRDCILLMSKMQESKMPKTNGPSPLQESSF